MLSTFILLCKQPPECFHLAKLRLYTSKQQLPRLPSPQALAITILFFVSMNLTTFSSVQFNRLVVSDSFRPHGLQHSRLPCPSPVSQSLLRFMSIESVMPSNHLIFCHNLFHLPSICPSIRVFSNEAALLIRWPKYCSFSFSTSSSSEYSGLISIRIDWFDLLAGQ